MANGDSRFTGLLQNPLFTTGLGLLGSGLSRTRSTGEALLGGLQVGQQLQSQALENQFTRRALQERARQRQASQQLQEFVTQPLPVGPVEAGTGLREEVVTPQQKQLGLLAQAAPDAFVKAWIGQQFPQERSQTSLVRNLRAAGIDPASQEGRQLIVDNIRSAGGDELKSMLAQVQLQREMTELQARERELSEEQEAERQEKLRRLDSVETTAGNIDRMSEMLGILEQTGELVPGVGLEQTRRNISGIIQGVTSAFGQGSQERAAANTAFDELRRLAESEALKRAGSILSQLGTISNAKFTAARETLANPSSTPAAMRLAMADILDATVRGAKVEDLELENVEQLESQIEQLRNSAQEALRTGERGGRGEESGLPSFQSRRAAERAFEAGEISVGEEVVINGRRVRVEQ